jgi:putative lipoprotein
MTTARRAALAATLAALAGARATLAQDGAITGTAAYRERIALPPGAVLEVDLLDTARADASASVLASARIAATTQVPIAFTLRFDPARIDARGSYAVAARLSVGGEVRFRSDRAYPVLTRGAGTTAEILLVGAAASEPGGAAAPGGLVGAPWAVREIGGRAVTGPVRADITFDGQGRAYGTGGCNRFTGGYMQQGAALRFEALAQTNMACEAPAMEQEARFHAALAAVRGWRMEGGSVRLQDAAGATVMRLARD